MTNVNSSGVPHFICIGAQRAGTTWLYKNLSRHDDIFLPPVKELHYFDGLDNTRSRYEESQSRYIKKHLPTFIKSVASTLWKRDRNLWVDLDFWMKYFSGDGSIEWYKSLFFKAANLGKVTGEITPAYSILPEDSIARLRQLNSELKLIYILRNPIERSFSQVGKYFVGKKKLNIKEVPHSEIIEFLNSDLCRSRSDYLNTIRQYRQYFQPEEMLICYFDEIVESPLELLNKICAFLQVDPFQEDRVMRESINSFSYMMKKMPEPVAESLINLYEPEIKAMSLELGGYARVWQDQLLARQVVTHSE